MADIRADSATYFGVLRALFDCYEAADERCQTDFDRPEAANLRPFYRRALIESQLREVAASFPEITATARRSPASGWNHTLVLCGRIALTQNAVGGPEEIVQPSLFRQRYAARDNQRYLFVELEPEEPPPDSVLYGILIHGQANEGVVFPGFARIVFPKEDLQSYLPGQIDLFREFPEVVRTKTEGLFEDATNLEQIAEPEPELRMDRRQAAGEK
ncbi:MAG: hypothetical protein NTW96_00680 [Planctomycetia bacterium]|nr:hypothetical protein [Planctomycetia bacterium]